MSRTRRGRVLDLLCGEFPEQAPYRFSRGRQSITLGWLCDELDSLETRLKGCEEKSKRDPLREYVQMLSCAQNVPEWIKALAQAALGESQ